MAQRKETVLIKHIKKATSQGMAGRGRKIKKSTKHMNKHKRRRTKRKGRDPRLKRAGVSGYNKPKRTPGHKTKSHIVVAKVGHTVKTIRFGQLGAKTAGKPKPGESLAMKRKRASFKAR